MTGQARRRWRTVPIALFLLFGLGGSTVLAVAVQLYLSLGSARDNTRELLRDKAQVTVDSIEWRAHSILRPVADQGREIARLARARGSVDLDTIAPFVAGALAASPAVESLTVIAPGIGMRRYRRSAGRFAAEKLQLDVDSNLILDRLAATGAAFWSDPVTLDGATHLYHYTPVLNDAGTVMAAIVHGVPTAFLSREIARIASTEERHTPFILYGEAGVLAHPQLAPGNLRLPSTATRLATTTEIGDSVLGNIWDANELPIVDVEPLAGDVVKGVSLGDRVYLFVFRTVRGYGSGAWTVGTYLDGERTRAQVQRLALSGLGGAGVLVLLVLVAWQFAQGTSRPAKRLARAARLVSENRLDAVEVLPASRLRELHEASTSFNAMVEGLRERKVIRDLFGKFVPERVAAAMLHSPDGLAPQLSEATIVFVDLAGFTALVEHSAPTDVVALLNAYFTEVVAIIESHDGIVTQFQGDAVLAVFNVPRPVDDHAGRAVQAALRIAQVVAEERFDGHRLHCRIGIASGPVVAGNVGAEGRMNYTVHGDAVNVAARLEQLNKAYDTVVLIADSTVALLGAEGTGQCRALRTLGAVEVRGRSAALEVYTIAAPVTLPIESTARGQRQ